MIKPSSITPDSELGESVDGVERDHSADHRATAPHHDDVAQPHDGVVEGPVADRARGLAWSRWRRRHQHRARVSHYKRRTGIP